MIPVHPAVIGVVVARQHGLAAQAMARLKLLTQRRIEGATHLMCNPDLDGGRRDQTSSGAISGGLVSIDDNPAASLIGLLPFGDAIAQLVADLEDLDSSIASSPAAQRAGTLSLDPTRRKAHTFIRWARPCGSAWRVPAHHRCSSG